MSARNPLILNKDNVLSHVDTLQELINNSEVKPVLVVIKAPWCGFCRTFSAYAWDEFKLKNVASPRFVIVEIDDGALKKLSESVPALHTDLLFKPPQVYFPMVYIRKGKHSKEPFQPTYTDKMAMDGKTREMLVELTAFVDANTLKIKRSTKQSRRATKQTKNTKQPKQQAGGKQERNTKTAKAKNLTQIKKSLKAEIDAAFRKLMLQ